VSVTRSPCEELSKEVEPFVRRRREARCGGGKAALSIPLRGVARASWPRMIALLRRHHRPSGSSGQSRAVSGEVLERPSVSAEYPRASVSVLRPMPRPRFRWRAVSGCSIQSSRRRWFRRSPVSEVVTPW